MAAKEPVPARSSASRTRPPLPPPRAASLGATPSLRASRVPARRGPAQAPPPAAAPPRPASPPPGVRSGRSSGILQKGCGPRRAGSAEAARRRPAAFVLGGGFPGPGLGHALEVYAGFLPTVFSRSSAKRDFSGFPPFTFPSLPHVKASHPPDGFLEGETKGRNRPPGRHSSCRVDLNDGYLLECLPHLVFSLCACKRCQMHNGSLSVTELGCSLFRFCLKIQSSPSGLTGWSV